MQIDTGTNELAALRAQIVELQDELAEQAARAGTAMAALQERMSQLSLDHADSLARAEAELATLRERQYWLDRLGVDLNALMRRRGARQARVLFRALRAIARFLSRPKRSPRS